MAVEDMGAVLDDMLRNGIENLSLPKPARTWTYLLADIADKLKKRTLAEFLLGDEENYVDEYSDEYDEVYSDENHEPEPQEKAEKKGFLARLFGRKDK